MSTSVITAASSASHHHQSAATPVPHEYAGRRDEAWGAHPARRGPGRRKSRVCEAAGQRKNKQPQRGMGVEKLEKLRMLDRWRRMTEIGAVGSPFTETAPSVGGYGAPVAVGLSPAGFLYGQTDPFLAPGGAAAARCYSENCNACHKKKKFSAGDGGFLGLNNAGEFGNATGRENHHHGSDVGTKMAMGTVFGNSSKQGHVEVVAVHRKGCSTRPVMMEYEFFPHCKTDDEVKHFGNPPQSPSNSSCLDLSLKLAY